MNLNPKWNRKEKIVITYEPYLKKITGLPSTPFERDDEIEI
jgi:hypothetical protein